MRQRGSSIPCIVYSNSPTALLSELFQQEVEQLITHRCRWTLLVHTSSTWGVSPAHACFVCKLAKKSSPAAVARARGERRSFPSQTGGTETHLGSPPRPPQPRWIKQELSWGMQRWELDWLKASREMMRGEKWLGEREEEQMGRWTRVKRRTYSG